MTIDRVTKDTNQQVQEGIKISISGAIDSVFKNKKLDENYRESVAEGFVKSTKLKEKEEEILKTALGYKELEFYQGLKSLIKENESSDLFKEILMVKNNVMNSYKKIKAKIDHKVKIHLKIMKELFDLGDLYYAPKGNIKFEDKVFHLVNYEGESMMATSWIEQYLNYEFLMLRALTEKSEVIGKGIKPYALPPTHVISGKHNEFKEYEIKDVLDGFQFKKGKILEPYIGNEINKEVLNILKWDLEEVVLIVKEVFEEYKSGCNDIKSIDGRYKEQVAHMICSSQRDLDDPSYFVDYMICQELFTLASVDEFCKEQKLESLDYFSEL